MSECMKAAELINGGREYQMVEVFDRIHMKVVDTMHPAQWTLALLYNK